MNATPDISTASTQPAALPPALQARLLAAMHQAADEERDCREVEQVLRRMQPAPLSAQLTGRVSGQMYVASQMRLHSRRSYAYWWRGGAVAAAAVALVAVGAPLLLPGSAVAQSDSQGLVGRNIIDSRGMDRVVWRRGEAPVRHYEVIYEDSFVLETDDTTTVIRVPNRAEVEVEEEYL